MMFRDPDPDDEIHGIGFWLRDTLWTARLRRWCVRRVNGLVDFAAECFYCVLTGTFCGLLVGSMMFVAAIMVALILRYGVIQ